MIIKLFLKITGVLVSIVLISLLIYTLSLRNWSALPERTYIAHAAGEIDGYKYTNSLEAIENAVTEGYTHIEIDFRLTSDSILVAVHEWPQFREMTGHEISEKELSYDEFISSKIHGYLHPVSAQTIDSIFKANPHLTLVTDKTDNIGLLSRNLPSLKGRMIVECFCDKAYNDVKKSGFATPMRSGFGAPLRKLYYGNQLSTIMHEESRRQIKNTLQYFIATKIFNTPISVYILKNDSADGIIDKRLADSIMDSDNNVRYVYIDQL